MLVNGVIVHEASHWGVAQLLGYNIEFRLGFGKFGIPRGLWTMPARLHSHRVLIGLAGFLGEFFMSMMLWASYDTGIPVLAFLVHIAFYPIYAGEQSDFQYF
jgi:hypothetical protein